MNTSKKSDPRFWRKWYASGAVRHNHPKCFEGGACIDALTRYLTGYAKGYNILAFKDVGPTLYGVVVPENKKHRLGSVLTTIPKNAVPVESFFARKT